MRDRTTTTITKPLSEILEYLFDNNGDREQSELDEKEDEVKNIAYDLCNPIAVAFTVIDDLKEMGVAAENEFSPTQLVDKGIQIIKNTNEFETSLGTWLEKPSAAQTWNAFVLHFTRAHTNWRRTKGKIIKGSNFHQENILAEKVLQEVKNV